MGASLALHWGNTGVGIRVEGGEGGLDRGPDYKVITITDNVYCDKIKYNITEETGTRTV